MCSTRKAGLQVIGHGLVMILWGAISVVAGTARRKHCLTYAMEQFQKHGGAIVLTRSTKGRYMHVRWTKDYSTFEEYNPNWDKQTWRWPWPPFLFAGHVDTVERAIAVRVDRLRQYNWRHMRGVTMTTKCLIALWVVGIACLVVEWRLGWIQEFMARL